MSDALQTLEPIDADITHDAAVVEYVENASRYDGSRTNPQKIALIHQLHRAGRSQTAIGRLLAMDARVVKAVLARQDTIVMDARNLLKANALGFAGDAIQASQEAAKRGKGDVAVALLDRLGVTEPPKSQPVNQVAVQVVLNGGMLPSELTASVDMTPATQGIYAKSPTEMAGVHRVETPVITVEG